MQLERSKIWAGGQRWAVPTLLVLLLPWLWAAGYLVTLPEEVFTTNLILDDSLYFAVPAQHFWQGHGLSFDGLELTNGVQTLWMLVTLALAFVCSEPLTLLRAMVATSALLWLVASLLLYPLLRGRSPAGAVLAAVGLAYCGVHGRLAFTGMENGVSALAGAMVLLVGSRAVASGWSRRGALLVGFAIAVFALCRTEAVLLGPLVGGALLFGWLGSERSLSERVRLLAWLALPGVVLVGAALLTSRLVFGLWLPISGSVKAFYEQQQAANPPHGGWLENLFWHLRHVFNMALAPLREDLPAVLSSWTGMRVRWFRSLVWILLASGVGCAAWRWLQARRAAIPAGASQGRVRLGFKRIFAIYAGVHLVVMATALPHFTGYGSWYFTPEVLVVWVAVGGCFAVAGGRLGAVALALAILATIGGTMCAPRVAHDMITSRLRSGGIWLEQHVAPGTTVGALSSGLAAWYAPSLHVVNLDGLINNRRYFEEFLKPARVHDYFEDKGIEWFADYQPLVGWRNGISWHGRIPAERLVPHRYWRLADEHAYVVWQVLPRGESFVLLGDSPLVPRDRYVELAVAADVHGRFQVVRDSDLHATIAANPELAVARSIVEEPKLELLHVLATRSQLQEIALDEASVSPEVRLDAVARQALPMLGFDETRAIVAGQQRVAVTLYWHGGGGDLPQDLQLVALVAGQPMAAVPVGNCHETLPMTEWRTLQVIPETVVVQLGEAADYELEIRGGGSKAPLCRLVR